MMASTGRSVKLLARCCKPAANRGGALGGWSSAAGDLILTSTSTNNNNTTNIRRTFSSNNNKNNNRSNKGGLGSFKIRRPPGSGGGGGGIGGQSQMGAVDVPNPAAPLPARKDSFRQHIVDLFPGDYGDDYDEDGGVSDEEELDDDDDNNFLEMEDSIAELYQQQQEWEAKKERWRLNSMAPVRVPVIDFMGRSYGRGGRKTAEARVWITPGFGNVTVNRSDFLDYFPRRSDREKVLDPIVATQTSGKFDLQCIVKGGGLTGQAGAIRLGVARALQHWNPDYRPVMKKMGYLTRDARKVERKKIGRVKARKRPQWNRR